MASKGSVWYLISRLEYLYEAEEGSRVWYSEVYLSILLWQLEATITQTGITIAEQTVGAQVLGHKICLVQTAIKIMHETWYFWCATLALHFFD